MQVLGVADAQQGREIAELLAAFVAGLAGHAGGRGALRRLRHRLRCPPLFAVIHHHLVGSHPADERRVRRDLRLPHPRRDTANIAKMLEIETKCCTFFIRSVSV